jgi:pimeloyl-ACP methyl ester carboxylesterase
MWMEDRAGSGSGQRVSAHANRCDGVVRPAPYTDRFIDVDGLRVHYLDYGTAGSPAVLCVHGAGANAHWFDFVAGGLSADYHVLAVDLPGHGDSRWADPAAYTIQRYAAAIAEMVELLDLREFTLIGHSMGGTISLVYAAEHPGRAARLIVVDSTLHLRREQVALLRDLGSRPPASYATSDEFIDHYRIGPAGTSAPPEIFRHVALHSGRPGADGRWRHKFDRKVYAMRVTFDGLPYWSKIAIPSLLVKGARSHNITTEVLRQVKQRCAHVELTEVCNTGHHVMLDAPREFERAVREFLPGNGAGKHAQAETSQR